MASIFRTPENNWRVQIRRKGKYVTRTFARRKEADEWAVETERLIDMGFETCKAPCLCTTSC